MTLDENGTAVGEPRRYVFTATCPYMYLTFCSPRRADREAEEDGGDDDDDEDEDEDEEDGDDEDEDEDEDEDALPSSFPELSRAERRELKKKQAAEKAAAEGEDGEDELLVNPNRVTKKLNISDLSAPRELTRRERCVPFPPVDNIHIYMFSLGSRKRNKRPRIGIGR